MKTEPLGAFSCRAVVVLCALALAACTGGSGGGDTTTDTTPPETAISGSPPALTNAASASFTFSSSKTGSTFEVSLDGGGFAAVQNPFQTGSLADGPHTLSVRARDAAGNVDATPTSFNWTVDTQPPDTSLTSTPQSLVNSGSASFHFTSSEPNSTFEVSVNSGAFASAASPFQASGLPEGTHTFAVRARDAAGNVDLTPASFTWKVDTTPPSVQIAFPTGVSYTDASALTVRGRAQDANGTAGVTVNGIPATSSDGFASWTASVPIVGGPNTITVSATDMAGNNVANAASAQVTNNGTPTIGVRAMEMDTTGNRVLLVDESLRAVLAVDRATGRVSILSDRSKGAGTNFSILEGLAVDSANSRVLVLDWDQNALFAVDLSNGNRSVLSSSANSTASTDLTLGSGVALDAASNAAYVVTRGNRSVVKIDLGTGGRTVVSSDTVGTGSTFVNPADIVFDSVNNPGTPRLLVSDAGAARKAIFAVEVATGNRTILSSTSPTGTGVALEAPLRMKLDAANARLLVVDGDIARNALVAVNLADGNRTTLADASTGIGLALKFPLSVALDAASGHAFVAAASGGEIADVNLSTLQRSLFASSNVGTGPKLTSTGGIARRPDTADASLLVTERSQGALFSLNLRTGVRTQVSGPGVAFSDPTQIVVDAASNPGTPRALVLDFGKKALFGVDLATGNRTIVSDVSTGLGPVLSGPRDLVLDSANNRVLVADAATNLATQGLFAIDLATGNRTVLSDAATGTGTTLILPLSVVLDDVSNPGTPRALVSDAQRFGVITVDLGSGNRVMLSSSGAPFGTGIPFLLPGDGAFDGANQRELVTDLSHNNVISVNLTNGNRALVSGRNAATEAVLGSGPVFSFPSAIDADFPNNVGFVTSANHSAVMAVDFVSGDRVMIAR